MDAPLLIVVALLQVSPATDPHSGRFTVGLGRRCASCHDETNPRAEDEYRAAQRMIKMVDGLNKGPIRPYGRVDCVSCHREGGPEHRLAHPQTQDRAAVERLMSNWPGDPGDAS